MPKLMQRAAPALLACCLLAVTGCGGGTDDDGEAAATDAAGTATTAAPQTQADGTAPAADSGGGDFCQAMVAEGSDTVSALNTAAGGTVGPEDFAEVMNHLKAIDPPDEIAEDWNVVLTTIGEFEQAFAGIDPTDPQAAGDIQAKMLELQEQRTRLMTAAKNLRQYFVDECG